MSFGLPLVGAISGAETISLIGVDLSDFGDAGRRVISAGASNSGNMSMSLSGSDGSRAGSISSTSLHTLKNPQLTFRIIFMKHF